MNPLITPSTAAGTEARAAPGQPRTLGEMVLEAARRFPGVALQYRRDGQTEYISYSELGSISSEIARGLISLGIGAGDRVAILGLTSAQWTLADCGIMCAGAVATPVYDTNSPEECAYVLEHSGSRVIFCENPAQAAKINQVSHRLPSLEQIVMLDGSESDGISVDELRRRGAGVPPDAIGVRLAQISPDDIATLVYTSGTTGPPKGCMLSHTNFLSTMQMYAEQLNFNNRHSLYQFLPLAHVLARVAQMVALSVGARVIYWTGDPGKIMAELGETAPTHFPAVPRIYEKVRSAVVGRMEDGSMARKLMFRWALGCGHRARQALRSGKLPSLTDDVQYRIADQLILSKVRNLFGAGLELAMVGAAPIARELLEFFDACGVLVLEGYGLTETCAASAMNTVDAVKLGTVGKPLPGTEIAIAADGEVMLRGPHVFQGYYRDPEATEEALTPDGRLHTGDIGVLDSEGFLRITGRKKDLIITSSGKNISPVNIESMLRDRRYISEAVVFGDRRPYLVAMLTLDRDEAGMLAQRVGLNAAEGQALARRPEVRSLIQHEIDAVNAKLARIEQIKRFTILDRELSQAEGELTPTLKVKRATVYEKFADSFAELYEAK